MESFKVVGKNVLKVDGLGLSCGKEEFTDDIYLKGMLYAKILTSPHAHARIIDIDKSQALEIDGVAEILTHKDVPRIAHTTAGQGYPEPSPYDTFILDNKVRFVGDRVCAVAAESLASANEALKKIKVTYEVLPAVLDAEKAMEEGAPIIHDEPEAMVVIPVPYEPSRNMAAHVDMKVGDFEKGIKESDIVIDKVYHSHYAQHCPIEPHIVITYLDPKGRLVIRTSTQVPFHVRRIVAYSLGIPVKDIRVIKPRIGGGFGAKQEVLIEDICALLTLKTKRPVKLEYTRAEEFISSRTRHPQRIRLITGCTKEGRLKAIKMDVLMNTGAYGSHALTVVCNSGSKVLPLYDWENIEFDGNSVYTNLPVGGAYRGYGATQSAFALESQMDEMAKKIGMDPLEFRSINHIHTGKTSPVFKALGEGKEGVDQAIGSCGLSLAIERGAQEIDWKNKASLNKKGRFRRGIGMAALMQGSSIPEIDMGAAYLKMNDDGSFNLSIGATDLGTGSDTVLSQIAAEELGVQTTDIIVHSSDTDFTPFDVGAYASSTTYLSGMAVKKAAAEIKKQIIGVATEMLEISADELTAVNSQVVSKNGASVSFKDIALYSLYQKNQFQIQGFASHISHKSPPPFSAHFVDLEVDIETGRINILKYVSCVDCGTAINPKLAEGQIEGAVLNGISFALTEEYIFDRYGRMKNPDFGNYKIFSTRDLPKIKTILIPTYEETGPYGAKSVSEICINGPMPAIANAIYDAVGIRLLSPPFSEEKILKLLEEMPKKEELMLK